MAAINNIIKNLNQAEKRYIKRFLLHNKSNNKSSSYLKLFDYLNKNTDATNNDLKLSFKSEKWQKNIPILKNHLQNLILKALRNYNADNNIDFQIVNHIANAKILIHKKLFKEASDELRRAEKLIVNYEKFQLYLDLIFCKLELLNFKKDTTSIVMELKLLDRKQKEYQRFAQELFSAGRNNLMFFNLLYQKGKPRTPKELSTFKNTIKNLPNNSNLFKTKFITSNLLSTYYGFTDNYKKSLNELEAIFFLFQENAVFKNTYILNYISTLNNMAIIHTELNQPEQAFNFLNILIEITNSYKFKTNQDYLFCQKTRLALEIYLLNSESNYSSIIALTPIIKSYLKQQKEHGWYEYYFQYILAYSNFKTDNLKTTKHWLHELLNKKHSNKIAADILAFSKIMLAIVYFETKDSLQFNSYLNSCDYFLNKIKKNYAIEHLVIDALKKLNSHKKSSFHNIFNTLYLNILKTTNDNPLERQALDYFNFIEWCKFNLDKK